MFGIHQPLPVRGTAIPALFSIGVPSCEQRLAGSAQLSIRKDFDVTSPRILTIANSQHPQASLG